MCFHEYKHRAASSISQITIFMFDKYATYGFEEFIQDEDFISWVKFPDHQHDLFWNRFIQAFPFQQETVEQAKNTILKLSEASCQNIDPKDAAEIWDSIQTSVAGTKTMMPLWRNPWAKSIAAAIVLLVGGLSWQQLGSGTNLAAITRETFKVISGDLTEIPNYSAAPMTLRLPDSSRITLRPGSRLRYKTDFGGPVREVYLSGEAFFDVKRNEKKPFIVYTNNLVTKVLGTSFNIKSDTEGQVTVAVRTGKVQVFPRHKNVSTAGNNGLTLRPNQQAEYRDELEKLTKTIVAEPLPVLPPENLRTLSFENVPVTEIFTAIEQSYGIEISFDRNLLAGCRLTTSFKNESMFQQLDVLCEAINATYKVEEARIVINGKKCL